jgi:phosphoribosylformylglycinamidine cyclo-ligase
VPDDKVTDVAQALETDGETVFRIGAIEQGTRGCTVAGSGDDWSGREAWTGRHIV